MREICTPHDGTVRLLSSAAVTPGCWADDCVSTCQHLSARIRNFVPLPRDCPTISPPIEGSGGMDWKPAMEQEQAALMRLAALLFAFAGLAELANRRSPAVRGFVLWILWCAETLARDFVTGRADTSPSSMPADPAGDRSDEAMRLAISFRALARQLDAQARQLSAVCRNNSDGPPHSGACMPGMRGVLDALSSLAFQAFAGRAPRLAPDTS